MGPELQAVMQAHQLGHPIAPVAPQGQAPQQDPSQAAGMPPMAPPPGQPQPSQSPAGGLTPEAENQIILQALATKLKSNSKIAEAQAIPPKPEMGQPPTA